MTKSERLSAAADVIATRIHDIYDELGPLADDAARILEPTVHPGERIDIISRERVLELRDISEAVLERRPRLLGAGVIFSVDRIRPGTRLIEWWQRDGHGHVSPVLFEHQPESFNYYEFERLPWFTIASETGGPGFAGPYIDWTGVDDYILTFTMPLFLHGEFSGVVGADITVSSIERTVLPLLRDVPGDAAFVNPEGRVIVGKSSRFVAGDVLRTLPMGTEVVSIPSPAAGLHLVTVDRQ